jgi:hypothetical protein
VLVDVTPTALEAGFRFPVAATRRKLKAALVGPALDGLPCRGQPSRGCSRIAFEVILHLEGTRRQYQTLILDIGPGTYSARLAFLAPVR